MKPSQLLNNFVTRNLLGLISLLAAHYLSDWYAIDHRAGWLKLSPYLYLVLLYGWLVFHNRVLFDGLYRRGRKVAYAGWLFVLMTIGSFNMNFILRTEFAIPHSLPHLVNFWVYTATGLGVYATFRYLRAQQLSAVQKPITPLISVIESDCFTCMVDGNRQLIPHAEMLYIESLENYLKICTNAKMYITRLTMKEAEERLPRPTFVRISRSVIVNMARADRKEPDAIWIGTKELKIGKVYKRYVAEQQVGA